jgi:hypothetical protein
MAEKKVVISNETFNFLLQACITDKEAGFRHALLVNTNHLRTFLFFVIYMSWGLNVVCCDNVYVTFHNTIGFYGEVFSAPCQTSKLEYHPLLVASSLLKDK